MKNRWIVLALIVISLCIGAFLYVSTRSESIYLNQWLSMINNGELILYFQKLVTNVQIPEIIIYSLPDGLWMFAMIMVILMIWDFRLHKRSMIWLFSAIGAGISFEFLQSMQIVRGTFDKMDLLLILVCAILPITFILIKFRKYQTV